MMFLLAIVKTIQAQRLGYRFCGLPEGGG